MFQSKTKVRVDLFWGCSTDAWLAQKKNFPLSRETFPLVWTADFCAERSPAETHFHSLACEGTIFFTPDTRTFFVLRWTQTCRNTFSVTRMRETFFVTPCTMFFSCAKKHFYWIVFHGSMTSTAIQEMIAKDKRKYFSAKPTCGFHLPKTTSKHSMIHTQTKIKIKMPTCGHAAA